MDDKEKEGESKQFNILDTIMGSQAQTSLSNFEPSVLVHDLLSVLKERDREIVVRRFGLETGEQETLESIGKKYNLTRERVRQIEKDSLSQIKNSKKTELEKSLMLVYDTLLEHGGIASEEFLILTMLLGKSEQKEQQALNFLLCLGEQFKFHKENNKYYSGWGMVGFNFEKLDSVINELVRILSEEKKVMDQELLYAKFKQSDYYKKHEQELSEKVLKSYTKLSKLVQVNAFGEIGLKDWSEIKPKDVGDKAYLVLKHHGKPEHYSVITKLINDHHFDHRTAYQETVHNELIKDPRFVLIGRGIYALTEWGYKKGVVSDVIREILSQAGRPLSREEIVTEVMKRRMVKRNTILVGLSNKTHFQKIGKDKYFLVEGAAQQ